MTKYFISIVLICILNLGVSGCDMKFYAREYTAPSRNCDLLEIIESRVDRYELSETRAINFKGPDGRARLTGACINLKYFGIENKFRANEWGVDPYYVGFKKSAEECKVILIGKREDNAKDESKLMQTLNADLDNVSQDLRKVNGVNLTSQTPAVIFKTSVEVDRWCNSVLL